MCKYDACDRKHYAKGLCRRHWKREWFAANPEKARSTLTRIAAWQAANKEKRRESGRRSYQRNRPKILARSAARRLRNLERVREAERRRREKNRDKLRAQERLRRQAHPEWVREKKARRRTAQPPWVDRAALRRVYRDCPAGMHVDHFYPLKSDFVCGLHVPWNLQYLTPVENARKGNSIPEASRAPRQ